MLFVTGAAGYVGRHFLDYHSSRGGSARCLVVPEDPFDPASRFPVETIRGDLLDPSTFAARGDGVVAVVHAAAAMLPNPSALVRRVTVDGTRNLLDAARRWGVKRFVYLSAVSAVYATRNVYGQAKWEAEQLVRESGLPFTILRPTMIFGDGGGLHFQRLVSMMDRLPLLFPIPGPGTARVQPVWIGDVVAAIDLVLRHPGAAGKTYGVSGASVLRFRDLVDAILAARGRRRLRVHVPLAACEMAARVVAPMLGGRSFLSPEALLGLNEDAALDHHDLARDCGYRPRTLESGLREMFPGH